MPYPYMTDLIISAGVACDITQNDIVDNGGTANWLGYVRSRQIINLTELSYQRDGYFVRVPAPFERLRRANYCAYRNTTMSDRWIFAYISGLEYKSDNVTDVYLTPDYFHTYQDEITYLPCFIERRHSTTDVRGENTLDEGLATGEYTIDGMIGKQWRDFDVVIGTTQRLWDASQVVAGGFMGEIFSGIKLYWFDCSNPAGKATLVTLLNKFAFDGHMAAIQFMYMVPHGILTGAWDNPTPADAMRLEGVFPISLDGYVPRNKKLLTYPYVAATASNLSGGTTEYRYEWFSGSAPIWQYQGSMTQDARIMVTPCLYKKQNYCWEESLLLANYPRCSWNAGGYAEWSAVQSLRWDYEDTEKQAGYIKGAISVATNLASVGSGSLGSIGGAISGAASMLSDQYLTPIRREMEGEIAALNPPSSRGLTGADTTLMELGMWGFVIYAKSIRSEVAKTIDEYFDMFGYACKRIETPVTMYRPRWNYIKTKGCRVQGVSADVAASIEALFDRGVRFWREPVSFCNYTLDNSV